MATTAFSMRTRPPSGGSAPNDRFPTTPDAERTVLGRHPGRQPGLQLRGRNPHPRRLPPGFAHRRIFEAYGDARREERPHRPGHAQERADPHAKPRRRGWRRLSRRPRRGRAPPRKCPALEPDHPRGLGVAAPDPRFRRASPRKRPTPQDSADAILDRAEQAIFAIAETQGPRRPGAGEGLHQRPPSSRSRSCLCRRTPSPACPPASSTSIA